MLPGLALHRLAARICSERSLERIVEPAIADLQKEYAAAGAGDASRRLLVLLTGYAAIVNVVAVCAASMPITDDERRALVRALAWSLSMVVTIAMMLALPPLYEHFRGMGLYGALTLVPQALPLAIPVGIAFGLAFGLSARPTMSLAKATLFGALAASTLSFGALVLGMPAANQAFRELTAHQLRAEGYQGRITERPKGRNEMTLSELRTEAARFSGDGEPRRARQFAFSFHLRFSLAAATFALVSVLLAAPVNHPGWRGLLVFTACVVYWVLMFAGDLGSRRGYLPPPIGAWLPNLALIATALLVASSRSSRHRGPAETGHDR